jgi:hypothetical protein
MKLNRILRNEEGASPGGGAVPPAPVEPQAQAEPPVTMSALKELLGTLKTEIVTEAKNGVNADLRRAGVFKKTKDDEPPPSAAAAAPATTGLSAAEVQAMLKRDRVVTTRSMKHELDPAKVRWLESALQGVEPERLDEVADSFLNELGLAKAAANTAPQPPSPQIQPGAHAPISDKGSPAPGGVLDWEREFAENPIGMSPAGRQRMDAKYGAEKARQMRLEAARAQADRIRVTKPQG